MQRRMRLGKWVILTALLAALSGCAGKTELKPVFWPPSPDLPRVQYLRHVKDSSNVTEQKAFKLFSMQEESSSAVPLIKPYGIAVARGKIYLTDTIPSQVLIIDLPGGKMSHLAGNAGPGRLKKPLGITVDDDGNIYVADTGRLEVLQYDPDGKFLRTVGKSLDIRPSDVKAEGNYLYILDSANSRILVLDRKSGELIRTIGQEGPDVSRLTFPMGLAADGKGGLYTTNFNGRIISFDRDGHFMRGFGKMGTSMGEFGRPRGIAADRDGLLYIADAATQQVKILDDQFNLLMMFGYPGTRGSLNVPAGIAVSTENLEYFQKLAEPDFVLEKLIYVVSQFGDHKVSIYGLGKKKGVDYVAEYRKIQEEFEQKRKEVLEKKKKEQADKEKSATGSAAQPAQPAAK